MKPNASGYESARARNESTTDIMIEREGESIK
jgi:hypothetical protein